MSLNRPLQLLLVATFLMNLGTFAVFTFLAIYLSEHLEFTAIQVGTVLTVLMITSRVLPFFCGIIADKIGYSYSMMAGMTLRALGFICFSFSDSFIGSTLAAALTGLGTALYEPAVGALFSKQDEKIRKTGFTYYNQALNAGAIIGPLIGGLLIQVEPALPFLFGSLLYFIISVFIFIYRNQFEMPTDTKSIQTNFTEVLKDKNFIYFNSIMVFFWFMYSQLTVMFPLAMFKITDSQADVSYVVTSNALCGLLVMFLLRRLFDAYEPLLLISRGMVVMATGLFFCWFFPDKWWVIFCVLIFTIGETLVLPSSDIKVAQYSNGSSAGTYFGLSKISFGIGASIGSFVGPLLLDINGWIGLPWMLVAVIGMSGALMMILLSKAEKKECSSHYI
ncbi:MFS transporter [Bacillus sp. V59.32b]|uniref:MDR family MFS transporter n=1 Tax=Bacillus sp. V59.32b TaxID=1758642 RepID=UPI000E3BBDAB|nr:MFS transporter [Bacillus sp. V59.32b]RFU62236.1 MFS transporter [Bacillus sp. V59.32b]